jgi:hypothetical protein
MVKKFVLYADGKKVATFEKEVNIAISQQRPYAEQVVAFTIEVKDEPNAVRVKSTEGKVWISG